MGTDRQQNGRVGGNMKNTQSADNSKPYQGNGAKKFANAGRTALLHPKQAKQNYQSQRHHVLHKARRNHLQTFDGSQHRDGWGNHPVTVKQAGTKNAYIEQHAA